MRKQPELTPDTGLLKAISPEELKACLADKSCRIAGYRKNNIVHFAGEACTRLEVILSGKMVIERIDESGSLMSIAEFRSGDVIGGTLMFSKNPYYPLTVTAKETASVLEISRDRLFRLFSDNHGFLWSYLEYVSDHTAILGDRIRHYVNRPIRKCVISYLNYERKRQNSDTIRLGITKKALAERIGVQRTSLSRELAKMRAEKLIEFGPAFVTLTQKCIKLFESQPL